MNRDTEFSRNSVREKMLSPRATHVRSEGSFIVFCLFSSSGIVLKFHSQQRPVLQSFHLTTNLLCGFLASCSSAAYLDPPQHTTSQVIVMFYCVSQMELFVHGPG